MDIGSVKGAGSLSSNMFLDQIKTVSSASKQQESAINTSAEEIGVTKEEIKQAVDRANKFLHTESTHLKFTLHETLGKYFVQLIDNETNEVVKEIPSKKILDFVADMQARIGLFIDERR